MDTITPDEKRINTIQSLDQALNRVVRCTDGSRRLLTHYDSKLGYYARPIGQGVWMDTGGTNLPACQRLFIGGMVEDEDGASLNRLRRTT